MPPHKTAAKSNRRSSAAAVKTPVTERGAQPPVERDDRQQVDQAGREVLATQILQVLEERGLPPGAWLVDIGRARHALQDADSLLRRLEEAIIRSASSSPLDGP